MDLNDNLKKGEELNQLSRLLFDKAANFWYTSAIAEFIVGLAGIIFLGLLNFSNSYNLIVAIILFIFWFVVYILRLVSEDYYDNAETMRRQSILTEGLGWEICEVLFSKWRLKAGRKIISEVETQKRDNDYYSTKKEASPARLLEMTSESAFYTRHLYLKIYKYLLMLLIAILLLVVIVLGSTSIEDVSSSIRIQLAYFIFLFLPIILSINLLQWVIRLKRLTSEIYDIEDKLGQLRKRKDDTDIPQVMRLIAEYNCQVVQGIPIHNRLFKIWHDEISSLWSKMNT